MRKRTVPPWIPLLRELTRLSPGWGVLKNLESALTGGGDLDSVAPRDDREVLLQAFQDWAEENGYAPVFVCMHVPDIPVAVAVRDRNELVELDLCERQIFRGSKLFTAFDLQPLMISDDRGFRRLRPGAEGLLLLVLLGLGHGGRKAVEPLKRKKVVELLLSDPEGVEGATALFGTAQAAVTRLAGAASQGSWKWGSALWVEIRAAVLALPRPRLLFSRAEFRIRRRRECLILPIILSDRRIRGDVDAWIERANAAQANLGSV